MKDPAKLSAESTKNMANSTIDSMNESASADNMKGTAKPSTGTPPGMAALRAQIPAHCFERNTWTSLSYVLRDLALFFGLAVAATHIPSLESGHLRVAAWALYGLIQGFVFTGMWILGHELGHGAMFESPLLSDGFGFLMHSLILVPYFSYKYSHAKHHRYTNHIGKDTLLIPVRDTHARPFAWVQEMLSMGEEMVEDAPFFNFLVLLGRSTIGWPSYLLFNLSGGESMLEANNNYAAGGHNHFNPGSGIFSKTQRPYVLLSDLGLLPVLGGLWLAATQLGWWQVGLLYGMPYIWMNHWLTAIAFLHHSHAEKNFYEDEAWTFQKGALSTVDRDFGFIGKHFFHGLVEYHVIHHLFPRIPFYHHEEATKSIEPLLGKNYLRDNTPFFEALWTTHTTLRYVTPSESDPKVLTWAKKPAKCGKTASTGL